MPRTPILLSSLAMPLSLLAISPVMAQNGNSTAVITASPSMDQASYTKLQSVLASDIRKDDKARDRYRSPLNTLMFFGVTSDMTVGEYAPGGGWYSRILAPYLSDKGRFVGLFFNPDSSAFTEDRKQGIRDGVTKFPTNVESWTSLPAGKFGAYTSNQVPAELQGQFDRILIMRMMHNLQQWGIAASEIQAMRAMLKPDGMIGIEQHRAKSNAPNSYVDGSQGYLKEKDVIAFMQAQGFDLVASSEINANPKDTADHAQGVWTLPPRQATATDKPEDVAKYTAIGESDRMTLLFRKRP